MKKKITIIALIVAILALAAFGSFAYFTDTDEAVNVMVIGNVDIRQIEQEWNDDETALVDFTQNKPLYPYVGTLGWENTQQDDGAYRRFTMENVVDKYISVENFGSSPAYVRTIVALEMGDYATIDEYKYNIIGYSFNTADGNEFDFDGTWKVGKEEVIQIEGLNYLLVEFIHQDAVAPGTTTIPSFNQVYMNANVTNEQALAVDGNNNGLFEILAFTQAVQTEGFANAETALDAAFGDINAAANPWTDGVDIPVGVATQADLAEAIANGNDVYLTADVELTSTLNVANGNEVEIDLNGNSMQYDVHTNKASALIANKGDLTIKGEGTMGYYSSNPDLQAIPSYATNTITNTGNLVIEEGVTVTNGSDGGASYAVDVQSGTFTLNGGTLKGERCALRVARFNGDSVFVMNGGLVEAATPAWIHLPGSKPTDAPAISVTINDGTFKTTKAASDENDVLYTYSFGNSYANTELTINGGEFLGGTVSVGTGYYEDAPLTAINGGAFDYDVLQWTAGGSTVLKAANN